MFLEGEQPEVEKLWRWEWSWIFMMLLTLMPHLIREIVGHKFQWGVHCTPWGTEQAPQYGTKYCELLKHIAAVTNASKIGTRSTSDNWDHFEVSEAKCKTLILRIVKLFILSWYSGNLFWYSGRELCILVGNWVFWWNSWYSGRIVAILLYRIFEFCRISKFAIR